MTTGAYRLLMLWAVLAAALLPAGGAAGQVPQPRSANAPPGARITDEGWFAPVRVAAERPKLPPEVRKAYLIRIEGAIDEAMYGALRRKTVICKTGGAELVILEVNTPGGSLTAMRKMIRLLTEDLGDIPTVAYVNPDAYSAGAIVSLACSEIVMGPMAKIGAAMPIMVGPTGPVELPEKIAGKFESAERAEVRALAKRNGYNDDLCEAMVTLEMEIWLIRESTSGELRIVDARDWRGRVLGAVEEPAEGAKPRAPAPAAVAGQWEYVRTLDGPKELVTLTADEARFAGLSQATIADVTELESYYSIVNKPVLLEDNWSERLVAFLSTPAVTGFLFFAAILCAYIEINTPGFGVPGSIAIACFAILFGSRFLVGLANWWEIALVVVGLALLLLEIFVIPGFGIAGIMGIAFLVAGLLAMFIANPPDKLPIPRTNLDWSMFTQGLLALALAFVCAVATGALIGRYLPRAPFASKLILAPVQAAEEAPVPDGSPMRQVIVGDIGVVEGMCRPVGKVRFGDALLDAASEGDIIEPGSKVRVLRRDGNRLIVERTEIA